jgi:hypothetical protein
MKKKDMYYLLLVAFTITYLLVACSNPDPAPIPEKIQKLIQTNWKIKEITVPKKTSPGDSSIITSCTADDIILFGSNGVFDFQDGTAKCDSTSFIYSKGYWGYDLDNDSIQLAVVTPASGYISWKVLTLNDSVLQVSYIDSFVAVNKILKTISFKK